MSEDHKHDEGDAALKKIGATQGAVVGGAVGYGAGLAASSAVAGAVAAAMPTTTLAVGAGFMPFIAASAASNIPLWAALVLNPVTGPIIGGGLALGFAIGGYKIAKRMTRSK